MPLTAKGKKILAAMTKQYGDEKKAKEVFYASVNSGKITGVEGKDAEPLAVADADGHVWTRGAHLADRGLLDGVTYTGDGYLKGYGVVARTGTQRYKGYEVGLPDRDAVTLYRPPEEVFSRGAMSSLANKPITLTHPKRMVDKNSWTKVARGFSGNEITRDGDTVRIPLMLTDSAAIEAFQSGKAQELSVGYLTDISWAEGATPEGEAYDGVQTDIRANHIALVPVARGGRGLRFGDAWMDEPEDMTGRQCPNCGAQLTGSPISCPTCGFDLRPVQSSMSRDDEVYLEGARDMASNGNGDGDDDGNGGRRRRKPFPGAAEPFAADDAWALDDDFPEAALYDRDVPQEERKSLAKQGKALPGGGYPIRNVGDLKNAIQAFGRAKNPAATKRLIKRRARELGAENELPEDWKDGGGSSANDHAAAPREGVRSMAIIETMDGYPVSFADEHSATVTKQLFARLNKKIRDQDEAKKKDDEDAVEAEQAREKKERGMKDSIAAKDGEIAVLRKQLADATVTDAQLDGRIAQRMALIDQARPFLPQNFKFDGLALAAIRKAVVANAMGDAAVKDWADSQIEGAFHAIARGAKPETRGASRMASGMADALRTTEGWLHSGGPTAANDADTAHAEYVKSITEAYKHPIAYKAN